MKNFINLKKLKLQQAEMQGITGGCGKIIALYAVRPPLLRYAVFPPPALKYGIKPVLRYAIATG